MGLKLANNAVSRLAAGISNSDLSLSVVPGEGTLFPTLSTGDYFPVTLVRASDSAVEIIKVTARATDVFTVERGQEGTTALAFIAGDRVELRLTAGTINEIKAAAMTGVATKTSAYSVTEDDNGDLFRVDTSSAAVTITLPSIADLTDDFEVTIGKISGDANAVTVARSSTNTINGATSYTLTSQYQAVRFVADRATSTWFAVTSGAGGSNAVVDTFTGDGTTGPFTLSGDPGSENNTIVVLGGVTQLKSSYSVSGDQLTFTANTPLGVDFEAWWSQPLSIGVPADASVTTQKLGGNSVTTPKIADANVTPEKLAGGTLPAATGYTATDYPAGTKSSGTFTPDPANGNFQYAVNGGAHTLAPPAASCTMIIQYTNNASAGAITTSGFTKVTGTAPTTTNGDDFFAFITRANGFSHLAWQALQ